MTKPNEHDFIYEDIDDSLFAAIATIASYQDLLADIDSKKLEIINKGESRVQVFIGVSKVISIIEMRKVRAQEFIMDLIYKRMSSEGIEVSKIKISTFTLLGRSVKFRYMETY